MRSRNLAALAVSGLLGVGAAFGVAACGSEEGSRESVEKGNIGNNTAQGSPGTVETGPTTIGSTAPAETGVTQTQP